MLSLLALCITNIYFHENPRVITVKEVQIVTEYKFIPVEVEGAEASEVDPAKIEKEEYDNILSKKPNDNKLEWFKEYVAFTKQMQNPPNKILEDDFTEEGIKYACRMVETECFGGDFDSKCNVASVLFNRIKSEKFPNSIIKVVTSPGQFTYFRKSVNEETYFAVKLAYEIGDTSKGALFFHSGRKTNVFNGKKWIFTDKLGHHFY